MELSSTTLSLYTRIDQIKNTMGRILQPAAEELGLPPVQMLLLVALDCGGPVSVGGLSRALDMNAGNVSTHCKRLEQAGLLTRTRSQTDERVVNLELTSAGRSATGKFQRVLDQCGAALDQLPPAKREAIFTGLDALEEVMNEIARGIGRH